MASKSKTIRICNELLDVIEKIRQKMISNGEWNASTIAASHELYKRIQKAGGLKDK